MDTKAINKFIDRLLADKALRKEFAANPKDVLKKEGIELPAGLIADQIDANVLEERLNALAISAQNFNKIGFQMDKMSALAGLQRTQSQIPDKGKIASTVIGTVV
jgi:hypothetical protein